VPKRFSPKDVDGIFDAAYAANTTRETKAATEPLLGLWLRIDRPITDIADDAGSDGLGGQWTRVTVDYAAPAGPLQRLELPRVVILCFYGEDARLVRALHEGDQLRAIGRIRSITTFLGGIVLVPALLETEGAS
jgi:hypothetical protein